MRHAVEKHFRQAQERARQSYVPGPGLERDIGLKAHLTRTSPLFLTLRADDGEALATAMLPPQRQAGSQFPASSSSDRKTPTPMPSHADAIRLLGRHYDLNLPARPLLPLRAR